MATLAAGASSIGNTLFGFETVQFISNAGTYFRYTYTPNSSDGVTSEGVGRSYGPAAQNVTVGPFPGPGTLNVYNESGSTLTWSTISPNFQVGTLWSYGALNGQGVVSLSPANANVTISPTGTGTVTINPATAGAIDNVVIGATSPATIKTSHFRASYSDSSGTPGNVTNNSPKGRVAIAAASNNVVVTNNLAAATSSVFAVINQASADATLTQIVRVVPASGSFTIYGNANATANTVVDYFLINS